MDTQGISQLQALRFNTISLHGCRRVFVEYDTQGVGALLDQLYLAPLNVVGKLNSYPNRRAVVRANAAVDGSRCGDSIFLLVRNDTNTECLLNRLDKMGVVLLCVTGHHPCLAKPNPPGHIETKATVKVQIRNLGVVHSVYIRPGNASLAMLHALDYTTEASCPK